MDISKYESMTTRKLQKELEKNREELARIRFEVKAAKEKDYAQIRYIKKDIARILSVLNRKAEEDISEETNKKSKKDTSKRGESGKSD